MGNLSRSIIIPSFLIPFLFFVFFSLQIVNHFPGMNEICRKDLLARNLNRMRRNFPTEYDIFPMSWCLPAEYVLNKLFFSFFGLYISILVIPKFRNDAPIGT